MYFKYNFFIRIKFLLRNKHPKDLHKLAAGNFLFIELKIFFVWKLKLQTYVFDI